MKVAIIHDSLMVRGGAEQVTRCFHEAFPDAPIYTLCYNRKLTYPYFEKCEVKQTWMRFIAPTYRILQILFYPFGIWAMKTIRIGDEFDVVLLSSTHCAKYVHIPSKTLVINYTYTPFRLAWNPESYTEYNNTKGIFRIFFNFFIKRLRKIDLKSSKRTNFFLAMTQETSERIREAYQPLNVITIISPAVNTNNFQVSATKKGYYLIVSRLEYYKKVDLAIEAFNKNGKRLIIVGNGSKEKELKEMANGNVLFMKGLSNKELGKLYSEAKAFVFPQHEDYGITPLEANASGIPVIAFGKGGVLTTMIPYKTDCEKCTAIFFEEQTANSLISCIEKFESIKFDPKFLRYHAEKFSETKFVEKIKQVVSEKYLIHFDIEANNVSN